MQWRTWPNFWVTSCIAVATGCGCCHWWPSSITGQAAAEAILTSKWDGRASCSIPSGQESPRCYCNISIMSILQNIRITLANSCLCITLINNQSISAHWEELGLQCTICKGWNFAGLSWIFHCIRIGINTENSNPFIYFSFLSHSCPC